MNKKPTKLFYKEGWEDCMEGQKYLITATKQWQEGWSAAAKALRDLKTAQFPLCVKYHSCDDQVYIGTRSDLEMQRPFTIVSSY